MVRLILVLVAVTSPHVADDLPPPAAGLGLEEVPVARSSPALPRRSGSPWSVPLGAVATSGLFAAGGVAIRRRREPVYVVVHGDGGSAEDFERLLFRMGVTEDRTVAFDYRSVTPAPTSADASRRTPTAAAAEALDRLIRSVARRHGTVYSIHHSRGGAVGVEMIAALDDGRRPPIDGYRGAALLDPAIGTGRLGALQRLGGLVGFIPDNGGFDPVRCADGTCRDIREQLGRRSGVEVVAIRNPDALVTNFLDAPEGLRVYDLVDDGAPSALSRWWNPLWSFRRVFEAHGSVLEHRSVADCVRAESLAPGSCRWTGHRRPPRVFWGRGAGHTLLR